MNGDNDEVSQVTNSGNNRPGPPPQNLALHASNNGRDDIPKPPSDNTPKPVQTVVDTGGLSSSSSSSISIQPDVPLDTAATIRVPPRPPLKREGSVPMSPSVQPPQAQPRTASRPQIPVSEEPDGPQDSLSLAQLKKLVTDMPKVEPAPYAFTYDDMASFEEELDDLFGYSDDERSSLLRAQAIFAGRWQAFNSGDLDHPLVYEDGDIDWRTTSRRRRTEFLEFVAQTLFMSDGVVDLDSLECLLYIAVGCWNETSGLQEESLETDDDHDQKSRPAAELDGEKYKESKMQMKCLREGVHLIVEAIGFKTLLDALVASYNRKPRLEDATDLDEEPMQPDDLDDAKESLRTCLTIVYLVMDVAIRDSQAGDTTLRNSITTTGTSLLIFLTDWLVRSRWAVHGNSPGKKVVLLYWKTILLYFGGSHELEVIKTALSPLTRTKDGQPQITASPLDYHLFRQEITSKYPAFEPPQPVFPYEPEHNSALPLVEDGGSVVSHDSRRPSIAGPANLEGARGSILHQPVHISTPAPSPPPTPALGPGGKGIKKQNYQTNQMFPFLYPPLEESSNKIGGKGSTAVQDLLAGRKWEGGDVPASILEAASLFSERMRASRAMKQLWQERVLFLKYERGAGPISGDSCESYTSSDTEDLQGLSEEIRSRLRAVDDFYKHVLPNLQSLVTVLLRVTLKAATTLATSLTISNDSPDGLPELEAASRPGTSGGESADNARLATMPLHELSSLRNDEISLKATSGILFLLLRWFKASNVLKFEYLSQLLLDSNYVQLTMKLFTHQELERTVSYRRERKDLNFLQFCKAHSRHIRQSSPTNTGEVSPSEDRAHGVNADNTTFIQEPAPPNTIPTVPPPPEVDELGLPLNAAAIPQQPITTFSWLTFFTTINHLRTLQKLLKAHPHRQLLMVQYKYSNVLKRCLKVPQHDIRLYALKVIKGQVPYYHRKWRQSNMRVITAIYLHCRPSLRDDWLAGIDVDAEIGEAVSQEKATRALTYFYNVRRFPDEMGVTHTEVERSGDFDADALMKDLECLQLDAGDEDTHEDEVDASALGRSPSPPAAASPVLEAVGAALKDEHDSTVANSTLELSNGVNANFSHPLPVTDATTAPQAATSSNSEPPSSRSRTASIASTASTKSRNPLDEEPDFFVQELRKMGMAKDEQGFWRPANGAYANGGPAIPSANGNSPAGGGQ